MEFQEHETLSHLLDLLPRKAQKGLMTTTLEWTCLDADENFIVIGANISLVYVYDRAEQNIIRLRPEDKSCSITCVKLQSSLDYQIAAGTNKGHVELYMLPSKAPGRGKEVKKIVLKGVHKSSVTCATWSTNGMKLFTGDDLGSVIYTEVDFYEDHHHSSVVVHEEDPIVQLSYAYKTLLISSTSRALLCYTNEENRCQQIGQQARKVKGKFGVMYVPALCKPSDATLYATRPGLRIWKAGMSGAVLETILFKEWLIKDLSEIKLLPDTPLSTSGLPTEIQFGQIEVISDSLIVVWSHSCLFILNPSAEGESAIIGRCHGLLGTILDVKALGDEIFILRKSAQKPVIRIGVSPEKVVAKEAIYFSEKEQSYLQSLKFPTNLSSSKPSASSSMNTQAAFREGLSSVKNVFKKAADEIADGAYKAKEDLDRTARSLKLKLDHLGEDTGSTVSSQGSDDRDGDFQEKEIAAKISTMQEASTNVIRESTMPVAMQEPITLDNSHRKGVEDQPSMEHSGVEKESNRIRSGEMVGSSPRSVSPLPESMATMLDLRELKELSQQKYDDIIFQPKPKKKKKKKKKRESESQTEIDNAEEYAAGPSTITSKDVNTEPFAPLETDVQETNDDDIYHQEEEVHLVQEEETLGQAVLDETREQHVNTKKSEQREEGNSTTRLGEIATGGNIPIGIISEEEDKQSHDIPKLNLSEPKPLRSYESSMEPYLPESDQPMAKGRPVSVFPDIYTQRQEPQDNEIEVLGGSDSETESQELNQADYEELAISENIQQKLASSWLQCMTPGYITHLVASEKHIWCVDSKERVYFSLSSKIACSWNKLKGVHGRKIAVSPSGNIVWMIKSKNNSAYASDPITQRSKVGSSWNFVFRDVATVCLDETMAWFILVNGQVCAQKGITREKPYTRKYLKIESNFTVVDIVANHGVVWARTTEDKVVYRRGITLKKPQGTTWELLEDSSDLRAVSIALDSKQMGWAIDKEGRVWFRTGVGLQTPQGDDKRWWQVMMSEYLMEDPNVLKMVVNLAGTATRMDRVVSWLTSHQAVQVTASSSAVWVCAQFQRKTTLQVSRGNLLGSSWELACPIGLPAATCWISLSAAAVYGPSGMIWAAQKSGEIFCFPPVSMKPILINPPEREKLIQVSANADVLWALSSAGNIFLRVGISQYCPQGKEWKKLDIAQLGSNKIVHLSCGQENVWACDASGNCYMRVGIDLPRHEGLPRAWLSVDTQAQSVFTQVCIGPTDNMVWAIDSKKTVYSRNGVTKELPVGLEWVTVEGTQAQELCISSDTVWALCPNGDIACRFGTSQKNAEGNYWKKIPGNFAHISVTQSNDLWGLTKDGQIFQRAVKVFKRQHFDSPSPGDPEHDLDEDWELL